MVPYSLSCPYFRVSCVYAIHVCSTCICACRCMKQCRLNYILLCVSVLYFHTEETGDDSMHDSLEELADHLGEEEVLHPEKKERNSRKEERGK